MNTYLNLRCFGGLLEDVYNMSRVYQKCNKCGCNMSTECDVYSNNGVGVFVKKKRKGLFNNTSDCVKASVCPSCGKVELYIEDPERFMD